MSRCESCYASTCNGQCSAAVIAMLRTQVANLTKNDLILRDTVDRSSKASANARAAEARWKAEAELALIDRDNAFRQRDIAEQRIASLTAGRDAARMPWEGDVLASWSIVGMNHYRLAGKRHLFVSMAKDGRCIVAEGTEPAAVFENLERKALALPYAETVKGGDDV